MRVLPNYVYKFTFKPSFSSLTGVYKVLEITTYDELLGDKVDLFTTLYDANSVDKSIFSVDLPIIKDNVIYKLSDINNPDNIQFIPESLITEIPNADVHNYFSLGIACSLGVHNSIEDVTTIKNEIEQVIAAMIGVDNNAVVYTTDNEWLTESEFQTIEADRATNISTVSNHYTDKVSLQLKINQLTTLVEYYEDTLKSL